MELADRNVKEEFNFALKVTWGIQTARDSSAIINKTKNRLKNLQSEIHEPWNVRSGGKNPQ